MTRRNEKPVQAKDVSHRCHEHNFLGANQKFNEKRTWLVIGLTATMMIVEIICGLLFGSMALLADGWHMASHAAALGITALGYLFSRRHASDPRYCFGTGKIGDLAGFSSALLLGLIALIMAYESITRLVFPVPISFDEAIAVAVIGLIVNIASAVLLKNKHAEEHNHTGHHADHNIKAAYLHVLADALTSLLAIFALSAGRLLGWVWMDPAMGIVGAIVISRWSYNLARDTGRILLDINAGTELSDYIRQLIEADADNHITDLHVWRVGPGHVSAIVSILTSRPQPPDYYKDLLKDLEQICHITVEINPR